MGHPIIDSSGLEENGKNQLEAALRNYYLKNDINRSRKVILLFTLPFLVFILNDYLFFGFSSVFGFLFAVRVFIISFLLLIWVKLGTEKSYKSYDRILFVGALATIACGGIINFTRPDNFLLHSIVTIVSVFVLYLAISLRTDYKIYLSSLMSGGEASIILVFSGNTETTVVYTLLISMFMANIIGAVGSREIHLHRKETFKEISRRRALQDSLEQQVQKQTKQLLETQSRLVKTERLAAIGELAGMIGHDLRNPLAGIKNAAYVLRKRQKNLDQVGVSMLDNIDQSVEHADSIINDLLDYSRDINLQLEEHSPKALIDYALLSVKIPSNISVKENTENFTLRADANKLHRVFVNLIKNAVEAMPKGGELEISNSRSKDYAVFAFKDTGVGMSEDVAAKIFTPLFTTKAQGMGLGLVICKRFVEAHKGEMSVESKLGEGTVFKLSLPLT